MCKLTQMADHQHRSSYSNTSWQWNILILADHIKPRPAILWPLPVFTRHGQSRADHLLLTSCQLQLCCWEEGVWGTKNSLNSWPLSRPRAGSEPELTMSQKSPLHGAFPPVLFQLSCYSPKPEGVFNRGLGITGLTFNSSGVKGPGHCHESMLHTTLTKLYRDLYLLGGLFLFRFSVIVICEDSLVLYYCLNKLWGWLFSG